MSVKKHIPNIITLLNLTSGLIALDYAYNANLGMAFFWVCMGIFFDFWDGFAARALKVQSPLGLQLDSLADMVTSGVVPGVAMFKMIENIIMDDNAGLTWDSGYIVLLPFLGFVITLGAAYRLAKFNVDTRQTDSFIGLPTPANALFIMSLPIIAYNDTYPFLAPIFSNPFILIGICLVSAFVMNAEIPLFSLKIKYLNWETNKLQFTFLILSILLLFALQYIAIPLIIMLYVILSVVNNKLWAKTA
ncbi:CDP-alcohol phosphatidyltransferase family protein [Flavobacterium sp. RHBU_24]|uniref:CDP-alcohol phosphatidyltransferase family protein n=1 Tax=Flavobacterium sp. RHBU_24 TaxID=3391185 RepID=UPI003984C03A